MSLNNKRLGRITLNLKKIKKNFLNMDVGDVLETINKVWPNINGQVTGYFSTTIFNRLREDETRAVNASIVAITISILYIVLEPFIRRGVKLFQGLKENVVWGEILDELMNVTYRFFIFIIVQYTNLMIRGTGSGFSNEKIFEQVAQLIIFTFILVSFVAFLTTMNSLMKGEKGYIAESVKNFTVSYRGIYGVVIQFFSRELFMITSEMGPNRLSRSLVSIAIFIFFLIMEYMLRKLIEWSDPGFKKRPLWDKILNDYLDFIYTFSLFFVVQYIGLFISDEVTGSLGEFQELAILFMIFIVFYSVMRLIVELTKLNDESKGWKLTNTTKRIWPKISGTTTGLIADIISTRLLTQGDERNFLFYFVIIVLLYSIFDSMIRKAIQAVEHLKDTQPVWNSIIEEILDFFFSLGLLLFLSTLSEELGFLTNEDFFETLILIVCFQLILSSVLVWFREFGKRGKKQRKKI